MIMGARLHISFLTLIAVLSTSNPLTYAADLPSTETVDRGETISMSSESDEGLSFGSSLVDALANETNDPVHETKSGGEMINTENSTIEEDGVRINRRLRRHFPVQQEIRDAIEETGIPPRTYNTSAAQIVHTRVITPKEPQLDRNPLSRQRVICRMQTRIMQRTDIPAVRMRLMARYARRLGMSAAQMENELRNASACDFELYVVVETADEDEAKPESGSSSSAGAVLELPGDIDVEETEDAEESTTESSSSYSSVATTTSSIPSSASSSKASSAASRSSVIAAPVPVADEEIGFSPLQKRMLCRIQQRGPSDATIRSLSLRWKMSEEKIADALGKDMCDPSEKKEMDDHGDDGEDGEDGDEDDEEGMSPLVQRITELPTWMLIVLGLFAGFFVLFLLTVISIALRARPR